MIVHAFVIGVFFSLFIYHLMVFAGRRHDRSNLYYALICFLYCITNLEVVFFEQIDSLSLYVFHTINIWGYYVYGLIFILFIHSIFTLSPFFKKFYYILFYSGFVFYLLCTIFGLLFSSLILLRLPYIVTIIYTVFLLYFIVVTIGIKRKNKSRKQKIVLISLLVFVILSFIVVLAEFKDSASMYISYFIFAVLAFMFAYALTDGFNQEYKKLQDLKKKLELKVRERTIQLEEANQRQTDFFINLAHETKTPLTLITNYLSSYMKRKKQSRELDIIKYNFDKLKNDMVNFLDIEKLKKKKAFYNNDLTADLSLIIESKIELFKSSCHKKRQSISAHIEKDMYSKIDPLAADRIINNLVDNAIKYTPEGGSITIGLRSEDEKAIFTVSDTGIGIADGDLEHIFNSYYQITHKKRNIQGMGMGLNIVKLLLDDVGGSIRVKSEPGNGTMFTVVLDRCEEVGDEPVESPDAYSEPVVDVTIAPLQEEEYNKDKPTVFVVEDNVNMLGYLQQHMYDAYNVFVAKNGKEGLDKISHIPRPHIIVSDIMMDEMDGYEFYYHLSKDERFNGIPFIFLTAKTSMDDKLTGLKTGAIDYISKPFLIDELLMKINAVLKNRENYQKAAFGQLNKKIDSILANPEMLIESPEADIGHVPQKESGERLDALCDQYGITGRQKEIIALIIEGYENKEIAGKLDISLGTVKTHVYNIFKKMHVGNRVELVRLIKR